jgi:hypothetical protein
MFLLEQQRRSSVHICMVTRPYTVLWAPFCLMLGCGVAQIVASRLAVRHALVRISVRHPREGPLPNRSNVDNNSGTLRVVDINIVCLLD